MGLVKRRLYKPERKPARKKSALSKQAPVACPDACDKEIAMALFAIAKVANVIVGQGGTYDPLRDEYTLIAKVLDGGKQQGVWTGKVQDIKIQGAEVAALIHAGRSIHGKYSPAPKERFRWQ